MKKNINKEKFMALVSKEKVDTYERNKERIRNRKMLRESRTIALKVLNRIDELGWSQKKLADEMEVSPQQITKIVSGKANLTLESQVKIQDVLNIPILASYIEKKLEELISEMNSYLSEKYTPTEINVPADYTSSEKKEVKMSYDNTTNEYSYNLSA